MRLEREQFLEVVRLTPLVSIDLLVRNPREEVLLGLRTNAPARDRWFVPGGRVCKGERLAAAFARIGSDELGIALALDRAAFRGVWEHLYEDNAGGVAGFGTHYVTLAHEVHVNGDGVALSPEQHSRQRWWTVADLLTDPAVHPYTQAYFQNA